MAEKASQGKAKFTVAEEVQKVMPALVVRGADGQIETIKYHELSSLLLNELIKQHRIIQDLKEEVTGHEISKGKRKVKRLIDLCLDIEL